MNRAKNIRALWRESCFAGDMKMKAICESALSGDVAALAECARVIDDACAQDVFEYDSEDQ